MYRNILITGYKGFIGSHLYSHLENDYNLIGIDKEDELPDKDFDLVIHLAGMSGVRESWKNPISYFKNNIILSWKIFKKYKYVIYASSSTVVEPWRNPYALSKYIIEKISPKNSLGVRFTTVYGPNGRQNMFVTKLLNNKLKYINIDCKRDFVHIQDVIQFFEIILKNKLTGIINVGTGFSFSIKDLVKYKVQHKISSFYEMKNNKANIKKIQSLGYKPIFNIKDYIKNA